MVPVSMDMDRCFKLEVMTKYLDTHWPPAGGHPHVSGYYGQTVFLYLGPIWRVLGSSDFNVLLIRHFIHLYLFLLLSEGL